MGPIQSFEELLGFFRRRLDLIGFVTAFGAAISLFLALSSAPTYQSHAVISARLNTVSDEFANMAGANNAPARLLQLVEQRLTTRENMLALAEKYDLFPELTQQERVDNMRESITFLSQAAVTIGFADDGMLSSIVIQARADDSAKSAAMANELADMLITQTGAGREARARETLDFLRHSQASLQAEIADMEREARDFATANAEAMPFNVEMRRAELLQLGTAIQAAEREVATIEAQLESMRVQGSTQRRLIQTREQLSLRVSELERLRAQRSELEPFFVRMAQVERELGTMNERIERSRDTLRDLSNQVAIAEGNLRLEASQQIAAYEVVESAIAPDYPVSRSRKASALIGMVGAMIVGVLGAFALEILRPALRSAGQVERETGMRPVLVLPAMTTTSERRKLLVARMAGIGLFVLAVLAAFLSRLG